VKYTTPIQLGIFGFRAHATVIYHESRAFRWKHAVLISSSHGGYTTTNNVNVSITCVPLRNQLQLDDDVSCCSQVDLLSAEAWHPTLLEGRPSGH